MGNPTARDADANQGEGNRAADRNYRKATEEFVNSPRGREEIREAGKVNPAEERELRRAEKQAGARAVEHDPEETQDPSRPA